MTSSLTNQQQLMAVVGIPMQLTRGTGAQAKQKIHLGTEPLLRVLLAQFLTMASGYAAWTPTVK
jgi:hypothetical protein